MSERRDALARSDSGPTAAMAAPVAVTAPSTAGPLDIVRLHVKAGSTVLLSGIDVTLYPGELCALIGPSGAGKSTLIKALLGLRKPAAGDVRIGGKPLAQAGPVGYVPQKDELHTGLTVNRALHYAALLRLPDATDLERKSRIDLLLKEVGLTERRRLTIDRLSGGQQKRVSVAIELLSSPALIILDEPTSGLDPGLEAQMMALFQGVARQSRIVMVATHAMDNLERCDALLVLVGGCMAYFGRPRDALSHFRVETYSAIFPVLAKRQGAEWARTLASSPVFAQFEARPCPAPAAALPSPAAAPVKG
jgi:ABC-type multidrug transport system ATPase subunit